MRGFAIVDRQPGRDTIAVWLTGREALAARNVNAVVVDTASDPRAEAKVHSLTRDRAVVVTDGSVLDGLPVEGEPLTSVDIAALVDATGDHQRAILNAISTFKRQGGSRNHRGPAFPPLPEPASFVRAEDTPTQRALASANYVVRAWTAWLQTDEERRRRTAHPRTGETPWIMPSELNDPEVAELPKTFLARVHKQPLV